MKITKQGDISRPMYRFVCQRCGCIFECARGEVKVDWDAYDDMTGQYSHSCPTCAVKVYGKPIVYESE